MRRESEIQEYGHGEPVTRIVTDSTGQRVRMVGKTHCVKDLTYTACGVEWNFPPGMETFYTQIAGRPVDCQVCLQTDICSYVYKRRW